MSLYVLQRRYFRARLADPSLLERAVIVPILGRPTHYDLAVPCGGRRRGGYVPVERISNRRFLAISQVLGENDGFPDVRAERDCVRWGEAPPVWDPAKSDDRAWVRGEIEEGRFYGYSEAAIREFLVRHRVTEALIEQAMRALAEEPLNTAVQPCRSGGRDGR